MNAHGGQGIVDGTPGRIRTDTELILSQLPLPLGYGGDLRQASQQRLSEDSGGPLAER